MRDVFIKAPKEFELREDQILKLMKPLYGRPDIGDYWAKTMTYHLRNERGMKLATGDGALFFKVIDEKLKGLCATYVDDSLQAGDTDFQKFTEKTSKRFYYRDREWDNTEFAGIPVESINDEF